MEIAQILKYIGTAVAICSNRHVQLYKTAWGLLRLSGHICIYITMEMMHIYVGFSPPTT